TLLGAWELTQTLLVVSAMLASDDFIAQFKSYRDGVITSRNTFQKYFNQSELRGFIERTLDETPLAIAPGIFYIFKDKQEEQRFLSNRQRRPHGWRQLSSPAHERLNKQQRLLQTHAELFENFWQRTLSLGRLPANGEFEQMNEIKQLIGSSARALRLLEAQEGKAALEQARQERSDDICVYLALMLFEKRRPYRQLTDELKRDIKAFFGDYRLAQQRANELLFAIADTEQIALACMQAHTALPASQLYIGHSLILHKSYLEQLPALLRVYVGAATQLYGELEDIDLVKIHITSGKVSLMGYDDFDKPIPYLQERVKIKMAEQDVDFFDYINEHKRPPLLNKSYLMPPERPDFAKQRSLEQRLGKLLGLDLRADLNLKRVQFDALLAQHNCCLKGFRLYQHDQDK
ncbi:MAG: DNA phosphorothioation-associated putative methyltransferase, partial [Candidatus Saccharimonadales bacterium]|nr:DNA phosphorothioation-associated putative methyltransferase [Candidatus Saccharimonadales bacterium]